MVCVTLKTFRFCLSLSFEGLLAVKANWILSNCFSHQAVLSNLTPCIRKSRAVEEVFVEMRIGQYKGSAPALWYVVL